MTFFKNYTFSIKLIHKQKMFTGLITFSMITTYLQFENLLLVNLLGTIFIKNSTIL